MSKYKQSKALDVLKFILLFILVFVLLGAVAFGAVRLLRKVKQEEQPAIEAGPTPLETGKWYDKIYVNTADNGAAINNYINELYNMVGRKNNDEIVSFITIPVSVDPSYYEDANDFLELVLEAYTNEELDKELNSGDFSRFPSMFNVVVSEYGTGILYDFFSSMSYGKLSPIYYNGREGYQDRDRGYAVPGVSKVDKDGALLSLGGYVHGTFVGWHGLNDGSFVTPAVINAFNNAFSATPFGVEYKNDFFGAKPFEKNLYDVYCFANTDPTTWKDLYDWMKASKKDEISLLEIASGDDILEEAVVVRICEDPRGGNGWALEIDYSAINRDCTFKVYENSKDFPTNGNLLGKDGLEMYFTYYNSDAPKELVDKLLSRRPFKEFFPLPQLCFSKNGSEKFKCFSENEMTFKLDLAWANVYDFNVVLDLSKNAEKHFSYKIAFEDQNSEWASGKTATDYVVVSDFNVLDSVGLKCLQPFGEYIILTLYLDGIVCDTFKLGYSVASNAHLQAYDGIEGGTAYRWYVELSDDGFDGMTGTDISIDSSEFSFNISDYAYNNMNYVMAALFSERNSDLYYYLLDDFDYTDPYHEIREDWTKYNRNSDCLVGWEFGTRVELDGSNIRIGGSDGLTLDELCAWLSIDPEKISQNEEEFYQVLYNALESVFGISSDLKNISIVSDMSIECSSFKEGEENGYYYIDISFGDDICEKFREYGLID